MQYIRSIFGVICLFLSTVLYAQKTLIVELDDVLFTAQESSAQVKLGKYTADYYLQRLFDVVATLDVPYVPQTQVVYKNHVLPPAWCLYLLNYYDSKTMYERVVEAIKKQVAWFWPERAILLHAASIAFDPYKEIDYLMPVEHMHALLSECVRQKRVQLMFFSNKNKETLAVLQQKYTSLFTVCKYICISGELGHLKPSRQAYELLLKKYGLDPAQCYVLDGRQENIKIAQELGMTGILYQNDSVLVKKQLIQYKLL